MKSTPYKAELIPAFLGWVLGITFLTLCGCGQPATPATDISLMTDDNNIEITPNGCRIERFTVPSPAMGRDIRVAVILPPQYDEKADTKFPVLHTLHGMSAPYDTFAKMSRLHDALTEMPFIYTCFDCDEAGWYIDSTLRDDSQFETFFFKEFIPYLNANYRIDSGKRGLVGFSMGGFGAMYFALQKPEMFKSVCTLSAGFHRYSKSDEGLSTRLEPLIGPFEQNKALYAKMDTFKTLDKHVADGTKLPAMDIRCGTEDFLLDNNRDFLNELIKQNGIIRERLAAKLPEDMDKSAKAKELDNLMDTEGIVFSYTEAPGRHVWKYWHEQAPEFAKFFFESVQ